MRSGRVLSERLQRLGRIHVCQLLPGDFHQFQTVKMGADDGVAAAVLFQGQQLFVEIRRKDTRIAALPVVGRATNFGRMRKPVLYDAGDGIPGEKRLVGHQIQDPVAAAQRFGPDADGVADAPVRMPVAQGQKSAAACQRSTSGYCVTTATRENSAAGTASSACSISGLPSSFAASLFSPNRRAFPAAITTQPRLGGCLLSIRIPPVLPNIVPPIVCPGQDGLFSGPGQARRCGAGRYS